MYIKTIVFDSLEISPSRLIVLQIFLPVLFEAVSVTFHFLRHVTDALLLSRCRDFSAKRCGVDAVMLYPSSSHTSADWSDEIVLRVFSLGVLLLTVMIQSLRFGTDFPRDPEPDRSDYDV